MFKSIRSKVAGVVGTGVALVAGSANAALPAVIGTELTSLQTDGLALADLVWPVLIALFGAVLLMKLAKRFMSKV